MLCHLLQMYFVFLILAGRFWLEFLDFRSRVSRTALALFIFPNINYRRRIDINDVCNKMKGLSTFFLRWLLFHEWTSTSEALMVVLGLVSSSLMCMCVCTFYFIFYSLYFVFLSIIYTFSVNEMTFVSFQTSISLNVSSKYQWTGP